jgi:hypothetical protein
MPFNLVSDVKSFSEVSLTFLSRKFVFKMKIFYIIRLSNDTHSLICQDKHYRFRLKSIDGLQM